MQRNYDFIFKIVLVGPSGVGKTALLRRYADDLFLPTIGVDFKFKYITLNKDHSILKAISSNSSFGTKRDSSASDRLLNPTTKTQTPLS